MDLTKIVSELKKERQQIEEAIQVLERMAASGVKRRGRPPKWLSEAKAGANPGPQAPVKGRRKPVRSSEDVE